MVSDAERAELLACRRGVILAQEAGVRKLVLETDCMGVVSKLKNGELDRSVHGPLVEEIKELLKTFDDRKIMHVRRSANGVAHTLAKRGCDNKCCNSWVGSPPSLIVNVLENDLVGFE